MEDGGAVDKQAGEGRDGRGRFTKGNRAGKQFGPGNKVGKHFRSGNWGKPGKVPGQRDPRRGQASGKPVMEAGAEAEVGAVVEPVAGVEKPRVPEQYRQGLAAYQRRTEESRERARLLSGRGRKGRLWGTRVWGKNGRGPAVYRPPAHPPQPPEELTARELVERKTEAVMGLMSDDELRRRGTATQEPGGAPSS